MAVGNIAPITGGHYGVKSNASNFVYHDGRWVLQDTNTLYEQMPLGAVGSRTGWGDGTTQNVTVLTVTNLAGRSYDVGYDYVNGDYKVVSYKGAGGASYLQTVPYTPGTDTYGTTVADKLDDGQFNNSAFDSQQISFIVDQQGNTLIFALGDSSDITSMSPKDGLLVAYDGLSNTNPDYVQIESGFNRNDGTSIRSLDAFTFMKGSVEWVGVVYCGASSFKIAYHTTETTLSNYSSGWIVEDIGLPAGDSIDDHVCARSINGELYASVKGDTLSDHLYLLHGVIDTATNNSSFTFYNYSTAGSRGVVALTDNDYYLIYEDRTTSPTTISYKTYPLGDLSINPASAGTVVIDADISITNPSSSAHNVSSDMGFIPVSGETTNNELWHGRIDLTAVPSTPRITAKGTITTPASNGDVSISGLSFTPKLILFYRGNTTSSGSDYELTCGAASGTALADQWVICANSDNAKTTSEVARYINTGSCLAVIAASSNTLRSEGNLKSIESDGFTIEFTTTLSAFGYTYIAFGGNDLDIDVGTLTVPSTDSTDFSATGLSFQPKAVQVASAWFDSLGTLGANAFTTLGVSTGAGESFSIQSGMRDNKTTSDTYRYISNTKILKRGLNQGVAPDVEVSFKQFNSDGFTLTADSAPGGTSPLPYIAWGGNINVKKTQVTQPATNGVQNITGLGFEPDFTFTYSAQLTSSSIDSTNTVANSSLSIGFSDGVNSYAWETRDDNGLSTTSSYKVGFDGIYSGGTNVSARTGQATYANASDGFDLTWTDNDGTQREIFALSIGAIPAADIDVNPNVVNSDSVANNPTLQFNVDTNVIGQTTNTSSISNNPALQFNTDINITGFTVNSNSVVINPAITVSSNITVNGQAVNSGSLSNNPLISITSGVFIAGQTVNTESASNNPSLQFNIDIAGQTTNTLSNSINPAIQIGEITYTLDSATNINALSLSVNINAPILSTNING
jgi:hypothetical protein